MASPKPRLTAVERKKRKEIRAMILKARDIAGDRWFVGAKSNEDKGINRLLDELADVAQKYLKEIKCQQK